MNSQRTRIPGSADHEVKKAPETIENYFFKPHSRISEIF